MPFDCELAGKNEVEKNDLLEIPLIFHRRAGLQQLVSHQKGDQNRSQG